MEFNLTSVDQTRLCMRDHDVIDFNLAHVLRKIFEPLIRHTREFGCLERRSEGGEGGGGGREAGETVLPLCKR